MGGMGPPTKLAPRMQAVKAGRLLEELRGTLESMEDSGTVVDKLPADTQEFYREWMTKVLGKVGHWLNLLQGLFHLVVGAFVGDFWCRIMVV